MVEQMSKAHSNEKVRSLIVWELPSIGSNAFIEMYINPDKLNIKDAKLTQMTKTKGGFILQYWGEQTTSISLSGTTGDGGIEAINVLNDIYRNEQVALQKILTNSGPSIKRRQSLAQLATSVIMWYQGQGFRGFFTSFGYDEAASGSFTYNMDFTAVEIIGRRKNFMGWHKKPWSTLDTPSFDSGRGYLQGGAYGTNVKMGELNAPALEEASGILRDPTFEKKADTQPDQKELQSNLAENARPLTPSNLFS
jgi:hypothetical protein